MVTWSKKDAPAKEQEQDLSTLLSHQERSDLTLLIANVTAHMRKNLVNTFEPSLAPSSPKEAEKTLSKDSANPNLDPEKNPNLEIDSGKEDSDGQDKEDKEKAKKLQEKRERELSEPKLQDLKKDTLEFFDKWMESVILRVGDVVNSKEEAGKKIGEAKAEATPEAKGEAEKKVVGMLQFPLHLGK
jgi:hypothetical protein